MNTYDPADSIVYLHLAPDPYSYGTPDVSGGLRNRPSAGQGDVATHLADETVTTGHHRALPAGGRPTRGET